jgi:hypothetical protein
MGSTALANEIFAGKGDLFDHIHKFNTGNRLCLGDHSSYIYRKDINNVIWVVLDFEHKVDNVYCNVISIIDEYGDMSSFARNVIEQFPVSQLSALDTTNDDLKNKKVAEFLNEPANTADGYYRFVYDRDGENNFIVHKSGIVCSILAVNGVPFIGPYRFQFHRMHERLFEIENASESDLVNIGNSHGAFFDPTPKEFIGNQTGSTFGDAISKGEKNILGFKALHFPYDYGFVGYSNIDQFVNGLKGYSLHSITTLKRLATDYQSYLSTHAPPTPAPPPPSTPTPTPPPPSSTPKPPPPKPVKRDKERAEELRKLDEMIRQWNEAKRDSAVADKAVIDNIKLARESYEEDSTLLGENSGFLDNAIDDLQERISTADANSKLLLNAELQEAIELKRRNQAEIDRVLLSIAALDKYIEDDEALSLQRERAIDLVIQDYGTQRNALLEIHKYQIVQEDGNTSDDIKNAIEKATLELADLTKTLNERIKHANTLNNNLISARKGYNLSHGKIDWAALKRKDQKGDDDEEEEEEGEIEIPLDTSNSELSVELRRFKEMKPMSAKLELMALIKQSNEHLDAIKRNRRSAREWARDMKRLDMYMLIYTILSTDRKLQIEADPRYYYCGISYFDIPQREHRSGITDATMRLCFVRNGKVFPDVDIKIKDVTPHLSTVDMIRSNHFHIDFTDGVKVNGTKKGIVSSGLTTLSNLPKDGSFLLYIKNGDHEDYYTFRYLIDKSDYSDEDDIIYIQNQKYRFLRSGDILFSAEVRVEPNVVFKLEKLSLYWIHNQ